MSVFMPGLSPAGRYSILLLVWADRLVPPSFTTFKPEDADSVLREMGAARLEYAAIDGWGGLAGIVGLVHDARLPDGVARLAVLPPMPMTPYKCWEFLLRAEAAGATVRLSDGWLIPDRKYWSGTPEGQPDARQGRGQLNG